jgi:UDPglucose 6-dehydrogenase
MTGYTVVVDKSTVPVGTASKKVARAMRAHTKFEFDVVSNPEFLKEGAAIDDFMKPDRVVIGARSSARARVMEELYAPFVRTGKPILFMDPESAELTKYAANAMLATRISFMNEIANICEPRRRRRRHDAQGHRHRRPHRLAFLFAGCGYGGSCFPKDVQGARARPPRSTATTSRSARSRRSTSAEDAAC